MQESAGKDVYDWLKTKIPNRVVFIIVVFVLIIVGAILFGAFARVGSDAVDYVVQKPEGEIKGDNDTPIKQEPELKDETCNVEICSEFDGSDSGSWDQYDLLFHSSENPKLAKAPLTENLSGWTTDHNDLVTGNHTARFNFTPYFYGIQTEVRFAGKYQLRIGDGNSQRISVKSLSTDTYVFPVNSPTEPFYLKSKIQTGKPVEVQVKSSFDQVNQTFNLSGTLSYLNQSGKPINVDLPQYKVPYAGDPEDLKGNIGVGLFDTQRTGKVEAEFNFLRVGENP